MEEEISLVLEDLVGRLPYREELEAMGVEINGQAPVIHFGSV